MLWQICVKYAGIRGGDMVFFSMSSPYVAGGGKLFASEYFIPISWFSLCFFHAGLLVVHNLPPCTQTWLHPSNCHSYPASSSSLKLDPWAFMDSPWHSLFFSPSSLGIPHPGPYLQHIKTRPRLRHLCALPCLAVRGCAHLGWLHEQSFEVHKGTEKVLCLCKAPFEFYPPCAQAEMFLLLLSGKHSLLPRGKNHHPLMFCSWSRKGPLM